MNKWSNQNNTSLLLFSILGILIGIFDIPIVIDICQLVTEIFIKIFKLISMPILFLSIICCFSKIENIQDFKKIGKKTVSYTLFTTTIASCIALGAYITISPANLIPANNLSNPVTQYSFEYSKYLLNTIPNNIFAPFIEYNLLAVLLMAILIGSAIYKLPSEEKTFFQKCTNGLFALFMKITEFVIFLLPIAIIAFIATMIKSISSNSNITILVLYLVCIVLANLIQGIIVLPTILYIKKISPMKVYRSTKPAIALAFFTKSSTSALPASISYSINKLKINPQIARFTLPLCTTINMNACAAFILITILFALESNGIILSCNMILGVFLFSIFAAIGNASVPMGCYFMATSFLVSMKIPLDIMTIILPFYIVLDMLETAINVWSDICIASIVNKETKLSSIEISRSLT